jgi:hypothetical protein
MQAGEMCSGLHGAFSMHGTLLQSCVSARMEQEECLEKEKFSKKYREAPRKSVEFWSIFCHTVGERGAA